MSFANEVLKHVGKAVGELALNQKHHTIVHGAGANAIATNHAMIGLTSSMAAHPVGWAIGATVIGGICLYALVKD
ncbi:hypothetical protein QUF75_13880 [Desulfococcaceae bacterium HSG7]|nr:hypothetical protein [Desulfococcaceae bacterium HSG7]